jgi:hypothetical protein
MLLRRLNTEEQCESRLYRNSGVKLVLEDDGGKLAGSEGVKHVLAKV